MLFGCSFSDIVYHIVVLNLIMTHMFVYPHYFFGLSYSFFTQPPVNVHEPPISLVWMERTKPSELHGICLPRCTGGGGSWCSSAQGGEVAKSSLVVSNPWGYPQIIQDMDDHDLVLKQPWWRLGIPHFGNLQYFFWCILHFRIFQEDPVFSGFKQWESWSW